MHRLKDLDKLTALVKQTVRLEEVAQNIYGIELDPIGNGDFKALCPFHQEKTPSFGIRGSKQVYHCFGCKEGGDVLSLVQGLDNIEYIDALVKLAEHGKIDLQPFHGTPTAEERAKIPLYDENARVAKLLNANLDSQIPFDFIKKRRFNFDVLSGAYGVGYAKTGPESEFDNLEFDFIAKWDNVLSIPLRDNYGRVTGFRCKNLNTDATIKMFGPKREHPLPQAEIYGLYEARKYVRAAGYLVLVEGEGDVWQMVGHGYRNTAATMGTKLNAGMIDALLALSINSVILLADNDEAGRKFAHSVAKEHIGSKVSVKIASLSGEGKDPDEVLLLQGADAIGLALANAKHAFEYVIADKANEYDLTSVTQRLDFLTEIKPLIAEARPLVKELAIRQVAELANVAYEIVLDFMRETDDSKSDELHNIGAERIVLKKMLTDESFIGDAIMQLKPVDFYLHKHRMVFETISSLFRKQEDVGPDVVQTVLENKGVVTASTVIKTILASSVDTSSASFMLKDLRDKSVRRSIQEKARDAATRLGNTKVDALDIVRALSADLSSAVVGPGNQLVDVSSAVDDRMNLVMERLKNKNPIVGVDLGTDFETLNYTLHGLQTKRYTVLAAPSGAGKTALACVLAKRIAVDLKIPTLFFTFETGVETLTDRIIANISGVPSDQFLTGYLRQDALEAVQDAAASLAAAPLVMTERGMVFEDFASIVRHDVLKRGTKYVFVDYIQLMNKADARGLRRDLEVGEISRGMLELAKELDIGLVAVAQQNRESIKTGHTTKEGIGDSYKIAQDCDIFIVFRQKTKDELAVDGPEKGNRVAILDKNRHGKGGVIMNFNFDQDIMRFTEVKGTRVKQ